jgi:LacI family transcriptional regulator
MPTLADVAKVAGVGVMSVSRVVNGTRRVSPETERRVRAAIERIGYAPNEAARILKGHRGRIIGLIVPDLADRFFSVYANAVQEKALEDGYLTLMVASGHRIEIERRETEIMVQRQVAGLLVTPCSSQNDHFVSARKAGIPIVSFDRPLDHMDADAIIVDNRAAASRVTEHLIVHKHRNILCIADDEKIFTKTERVAGYSEVMRRAGLPARVCLVGPISGSVSHQLGLALDSRPVPTAIFATSNVIALEVLRKLQKRAVRIPEKIAIIAFDDFDAATLVRPTITVVRQPVVALWRKAASVLLNRLRAPVPPKTSEIVLPTELIIRESCGCRVRHKTREDHHAAAGA